MSFSANKKTFLANRSLHNERYQLGTDDLRKLALHYQKKYQIPSIINGDTLLGQAFTADNIDLTNRVSKEPFISTFSTWKKLLANVSFLELFWKSSSTTNTACLQSMPAEMRDEVGEILRRQAGDPNKQFTISAEQRAQLNTLLSRLKLLDKNGRLKTTMTKKEMRILSNELDNIPSFFEPLYFIGAIDAAVNALRKQKREGGIEDVGISKTQVVQEIETIRQSLKPGERVTYFFTNQKRKGMEHFEPLILTKDKIIRPINWNMLTFSITSADIHDLYSSDWISGTPQVTSAKCGSLSMLYSKELLKENGKQLDEYTLCFPCYESGSSGNLEKRNYFLPSPQVLRYSQSDDYNLNIVALLQSENSAAIVHASADMKYIEEEISLLIGGKFLLAEKTKEKIITLDKKLKDSIKIATEKGDNATATINKEILAKLPAFREKWLAEYKNADNKRALLKDEKGLNRYLAYRAKRMTEKAANAPLSDTSFFLQFLIAHPSTPAIQAAIEPLKRFAREIINETIFQQQPHQQQCAIILGLLLSNRNKKQEEATGRGFRLTFWKKRSIPEAVSFINQHTLPWIKQINMTNDDCLIAFKNYSSNKYSVAPVEHKN